MFSSERLRKVMDISGYTENRLAEDSGIPVSVIHGYLNGRTAGIPAERLEAIADALCCPADYLLGRKETADWDIDKIRTDIARYVIEKTCSGDKVSSLSRSPKKTYIPGDTGKPIAVWPYNLLEEVDTKGCISIPVSPDQEKGLEYALTMLSEREQDILSDTYKAGLSYEKTGERHDITRARVGQIISRAIRKLRHEALFGYIRYGYEAFSDHRQESSKG